MAALLLKADTGTDDDTELYQGYVMSRAISLAGKTSQLGQIANPVLLVAKPGTDVTIQATARRDYGLESTTATLDLTDVGSATRVIRKFEALPGTDIGRAQFTLGDVEASANAWSLDLLHVAVIPEGSR